MSETDVQSAVSAGQEPETAGGAQTGQEPGVGIQDLESAMTELKRVRAEAAARRREAAELAAKLKTIEDAQLSETEKLRRELEESRRAAQDAARVMLDAKLLVAASKLGFADPHDALALVDRSEIGADGEGIDDALSAVLKAKPYLRAQAQSAPKQAAGNPAGGAAARLDDSKHERARQLFPFLATRRIN